MSTVRQTPNPGSSHPDRRDTGTNGIKDATRLDRKAKGIYYTPPALAKVLVDWVIDPLPKRILEPSYGDGVFLRAAQSSLEQRGVTDGLERLLGIDIDPGSAVRAQDAGLAIAPERLVCGDLLSFDTNDLGGRFDAIVGNPPYIRHHLLPDALAARGRRSARQLGIELNGRTDAWAYFCVHLVSFLATRGKLALVLPGSVLQADYAVPLLDALAADTGEVQLIRIRERIFPEAQERTVVLLLDRTKSGGGQTSQRQLSGISSLRRALKRDLESNSAPGQTRRSKRAAAREKSEARRLRTPWALTKAESRLYGEICAHESVARLGDLVDIRIGVVTGANDFFVLRESEIAELGDGIQSAPIVSRGAWLKQPLWGPLDQRRVSHLPSQLLLVDDSDRQPPLLREKIREGQMEGLDSRHHCARRQPWYAITDAWAPQLFLPYMGRRPPRIVVNRAKATCTNAVHRLQTKTSARCSASRIAAASWSTLYVVSAELAGRSYGGGVLKLEPSRAAAMPVVLPPSAELIRQIAEISETDGTETAALFADQYLLIDQVGLTTDELAMLRRAAKRLFDLRH